MALRKNKERARAKFLYFTTSKTQKQIADTVGVSDRVLSRWVVKEKWKQKKQAAMYSPEMEIEHLYSELRELNEAIADRDKGQRVSTKQELETRTKILALLAGPLKDTTHTWRNISPEFDFEAAATGNDPGDAPWGIKLRKRQPDGTYSFDRKTQHEYYLSVAQDLVAADWGAYEYCIKKDAERTEAALAKAARLNGSIEHVSTTNQPQ